MLWLMAMHLNLQVFYESQGVDPSVTSMEDVKKMARWYDLYCQGKAVSQASRAPWRTHCTPAVRLQQPIVLHLDTVGTWLHS
jgi:hypothetical protein